MEHGPVPDILGLWGWGWGRWAKGGCLCAWPNSQDEEGSLDRPICRRRVLNLGETLLSGKNGSASGSGGLGSGLNQAWEVLGVKARQIDGKTRALESMIRPRPRNPSIVRPVLGSQWEDSGLEVNRWEETGLAINGKTQALESDQGKRKQPDGTREAKARLVW